MSPATGSNGGRLVTATDMRRAALEVLKARLGGELARFGEAAGLDLPMPRTWRRLADFTQIGEHESPAVVVTTPGLDGPPLITDDNETRSTWLLRAYCVVRGRSYEETADVVGAYTEALQTALVADQTLLGLAEQIVPRAKNLAELDSDRTRTVGAGSVTVAATVWADLFAPQFGVPVPDHSADLPDLIRVGVHHIDEQPT